jgi:predicted MFS family arabinose efflux permease
VEIASVFLIAGVAAVVASPFGGWLSDRITKRKVFLVSNTLLVFPLLLVDRVEVGFQFLAVVFLVSLGIAFRQTALQTLQTGLISIENRGSFLALRNCFSQIGISVAVLVGGYLYATHGYRGVTVLAAGLTLLGSAVMFLLVKERNE